MPVLPSQRLFNVSVFTPQPGRLDEFLAMQLDAVSRLGEVPGLRESRLFGAEDGSRAIIMAEFDNIASLEAFRDSSAFQAERAKLRELLQGGPDGRLYRLVREREVV
jgi:heme-degrading monooxygenase HmoA